MLYAEHPMTHVPTGFLTANKPLPYSQHIFGTKADKALNADLSVGAAAERFGAIAHMRQVHGKRVVYAESSGLHEDCDAIYTDQPNLWLAVKTADCAPVLISSPAAVAAVHVGWRGLQAEVLPATIAALCNQFDQTPEDLHLAVGPCLSQTNFEVEDHFQHYFNVHKPERFFAHHREGHVLMDMTGLVRAQAIKHGLLDIHIHTLPRCTFAEADTFHSYRRDKTNAGRQLSLIQRISNV
jgi:YfiH family protein